MCANMEDIWKDHRSPPSPAEDNDRWYWKLFRFLQLFPCSDKHIATSDFLLSSLTFSARNKQLCFFSFHFRLIKVSTSSLLQSFLSFFLRSLGSVTITTSVMTHSSNVCNQNKTKHSHIKRFRIWNFTLTHVWVEISAFEFISRPGSYCDYKSAFNAASIDAL